MIKLGFKVSVESGAGEESSMSDQKYIDVGCQIKSTKEIF